MALKDERSPKYAFPEAGTSLLKSPTKSLLYVSHIRFYTFLNAGYWLAASCCTAAVALTATDAAGTLEKILLELLLLLLVQLTLQKGGFRQGNPMLLRGDSDCCCCCAHKDTALPDGETPWP